jgi:hypothetical protein
MNYERRNHSAFFALRSASFRPLATIEGEQT